MNEQALELTAAVTAGYGKAPGGEEARILIAGGLSRKIIKVSPLERFAIKKLPPTTRL
ncbi:MAG: hypothetical protein GX075_03570 [Firmicutes bacterium]|nr:hypothetical protein [Bacillota bacterium]